MNIHNKHIFAILIVYLQVLACFIILNFDSVLMIVVVSILGLALIALLLFDNKHFLYKSSLTIFWICAFVVLSYWIVHILGWQRYFCVSNIEYCLDCIKVWMSSRMFLGLMIYGLIIILHTLIIPISTTPFVLFGVAVFGSHIAFLVTCLSTIVGSIITFVVGKTFGKTFVKWLIGQEKFDKYNNSIKYSGKYYLAVMFLLPVFPDDILCLMAGASDMGYREFFIIVLLARPPMIAFTCYMGSGNIIPFSGWGIPVWIIIALLFVGVFVWVHLWARKRENSHSSVASRPNLEA
ncbi:MAG: VTT domain-containing protein [Firmicutes bacterium]|nr:VTT domain-containing protein [Bacillota bacterium]MCL1953136.1 VTT domain-containing protein [Bacillota bacterium]